MDFLHWVSDLTLGDRVWTLEALREGLRVGSLLPYMKMNKLKLFRCLIRMPIWCLLGEVFQESRLQDRPRVCWRD